MSKTIVTKTVTKIAPNGSVTSKTTSTVDASPVEPKSEGYPKASIQCRCGQVKVTFPTNKPSHSLECCCVDCYQKYEWSCEAGGVPVPDAVKQLVRPLSLSYFPSRMQVMGKKNLKFNKLRDEATSTNCVAGCCNTLLFIDSAGYKNAVVMLSTDFCPVANCAFEPPIFRCWIADWPKQNLEKLPPLPGFYVKRTDEGQALETSGDFATARGITASRVAKLVESPIGSGDTFADLLKYAGGEVEVLGLPVLERSFKGRDFSV